MRALLKFILFSYISNYIFFKTIFFLLLKLFLQSASILKILWKNGLEWRKYELIVIWFVLLGMKFYSVEKQLKCKRKAVQGVIWGLNSLQSRANKLFISSLPKVHCWSYLKFDPFILRLILSKNRLKL